MNFWKVTAQKTSSWHFRISYNFSSRLFYPVGTLSSITSICTSICSVLFCTIYSYTLNRQYAMCNVYVYCGGEIYSYNRRERGGGRADVWNRGKCLGRGYGGLRGQWQNDCGLYSLSQNSRAILQLDKNDSPLCTVHYVEHMCGTISLHSPPHKL